MGRRVFVFDLDGTLCNNEHRQYLVKKDFKKFEDSCTLDTPVPHILELAQVLARSYTLLFVSGRSTRVQTITENWLKQYGLMDGNRLFMRIEGDNRHDAEVKSEIMDRIVAEGFEVIMIFDDRNSVVAMWRARGIPCAQVVEGDF